MSFYTGNSPKIPNKYVGPGIYLNSIVSRNREPLGTDYRQPETGRLYPIGSEWIIGANPTTGVQGDKWYLSKIVANVAYWVQSSSVAISSMQIYKGAEVDLTTAGTTLLYNFPVDFIFWGYVYTVTALTGSLNLDSDSNMGWTAPTYNDIDDGINVVNVAVGNENGEALSAGIGDFHFVPAGTDVYWNVITPESGASVYTIRVDILGYPYN